MYFNDASSQDNMMFDPLTSDNVYAAMEYPRMLPDGRMEERVRVDRKLYEKLLGSDSSNNCSPFTGSRVAEEFFRSLSLTTNTEISWPARLRTNARSRKDPHIKITGFPAAVQEAKNIINFMLDTRINRVTIKMDVAFTDHSHVIGKGGRSIQKVMDTTGCHIHFPDSNRTNSYDKSNQVSIAGTAQGAEQARCRVRELLPVSVHYEIPLRAIVQTAMDHNSSTLQSLQRDHGLNITFKQVMPSGFNRMASREPAIHITIRGSRALAIALRRGVELLLKYLTAGVYELAVTPAVVETEIAAQHHAFVQGRGNCNLINIQQVTGADVLFPEPTLFNYLAPSASSLPNKRSNVKIFGPNFDAAYNAWLELMGYLPLLLIFDLPEGRDCDASQVTQMMDQLKVSILIKPKQKQSTKSVMVRGPERESRTLFEVRRRILDLDYSEVPFCCDPHYWATQYASMTPATVSSTLPNKLIPGPSVHMPVARRTTVGSNSSLMNSRVRSGTETSLTAIKNQRDPSELRRTRRLDTYDSTNADDEYKSLCRVASNCSISALNESFKADDVFASSLPPADIKWMHNFKGSVDTLSDADYATGPASEFGNFLSNTFPADLRRKDTASNRLKVREPETECSIV